MDAIVRGGAGEGCNTMRGKVCTGEGCNTTWGKVVLCSGDRGSTSVAAWWCSATEAAPSAASRALVSRSCMEGLAWNCQDVRALVDFTAFVLNRFAISRWPYLFGC